MPVGQACRSMCSDSGGHCFEMLPHSLVEGKGTFSTRLRPVCREAYTALGILPKAAKCGRARGLCRSPERPVDKSRGQREEQQEGLSSEAGATGEQDEIGSKSR